MKRLLSILFLLMVTLSVLAHEEEPLDLQMITRIKSEGFSHSKVMEICSYLTDVYGPRLTGTENFKKAAAWCRDKLSEWGLENARLESWGAFGKGWSVENYSVEMLRPQYMNIIAHPKAWTPGTNGIVTGKPVLIGLDETDLQKYGDRLKGAVVLLGEPRKAGNRFEEETGRYTPEQLKELAEAPDPARESPNKERRKKYRQERANRQTLRRLLLDQKAAVVLESSSMNYSTLRVTAGAFSNSDTATTLPSLVISRTQYNRIARLLEKNLEVELKIEIRNRFETEDSLGYNVIAEIPGTDRNLKHELVMLGAHLDSWHSGTGATDDAGGCAVMMEAVRILKKIDARPRRTIRIALWSGEEQGLLGSKNYVEKHFGNPEDPKAAYDLLSAYYNIDNGGGKIRGIYLQGNDAARPVYEAYFKPFNDLGASTVTIRETNSTDHIPFDRAGLPGFQFIQNPLDYYTRTWHTNMDTYDYLQENDLMQMSVIVASIVYHTAMREEKIPRKPVTKK